jgi:hypothetical protein
MQEALLKNMFMPNYVKNKAFSFKTLSLYRELNLRAGLAANVFSDFLSDKYPNILGLYAAFLSSFYLFRSITHNLQSLKFLELSDFLKWCPGCIQPGEKGSLFLAIDGNLRNNQ